MPMTTEERIQELYDELDAWSEKASEYDRSGNITSFHIACDELSTISAQLDELEGDSEYDDTIT